MSKIKNIFQKSSIFANSKESIPSKIEAEKYIKKINDSYKAIEEGRKKFKSVLDHSHYITVNFTNEQDKETFLKSLGIDAFEFHIDGYELANKLKIEPKKPSIKL